MMKQMRMGSSKMNREIVKDAVSAKNQRKLKKSLAQCCMFMYNSNGEKLAHKTLFLGIPLGDEKNK